jgi:hypothetical protein
MSWCLVPFTTADHFLVMCFLFGLTHVFKCMTIILTVSKRPFDLLFLTVKVHMKPLSSIATRRDTADIIFQGWILRIFATSQIEDPHFALMVAIKIVCFVAVILSFSALLTPATISYCAIASLTNKM